MRAENLPSNLVYNATGSDVTDVIVDGRVVIRDKKVLTVDAPAVLEETQARAEKIPLRLEIEARLQVQPEAIARAEIAREAQGGIGRDRSIAVDQITDPARRHINVGSQLTCRNPLGLNEVPRKDLAALMGVNLMQPEPANRDQAGLCDLFSTPFQSPRCRSRAIHDCAWRT